MITVKRGDTDRFIAEHGGVAICGDSEDGPILTLRSGWTLFFPVGGEPRATPPEEPER